jgi:hypothetical protein
MRSKLARTLLILGSVGACERAQPVVDARARPAVGNIGQAGRVEPPKPAALPQPVVEPVIALPMPKPKTVRRVQRVQRAAVRVPVVVEKVPVPPQMPQIQTSAETRAAYESPLRDRRERPAHANMGRRAAMEPIEEPAPTLEAMHEEAR